MKIHPAVKHALFALWSAQEACAALSATAPSRRGLGHDALCECSLCTACACQAIAAVHQQQLDVFAGSLEMQVSGLAELRREWQGAHRAVRPRLYEPPLTKN